MSRYVGGKTNERLVARHRALGARRAVYYDRYEQRPKWWCGFDFMTVKELQQSLHVIEVHGLPQGRAK